MEDSPRQPSFLLPTPPEKGAKSWLLATAGQALVTAALLGVQHYFENSPKEAYARMITALGIVATWSLALRTIRARLIELLNYWQKVSQGLLRKASESGRHWLGNGQAPKSIQRQEKYVKQSIRRLRIIAAGLTIPFFVMPAVYSIACLFLSLHSRLGAEYWVPLGCFMLFMACIVAGYFHWAIMPAPVPVRVRSTSFYPRRKL